MDPRLYSFDGERHEALCLLAFGQDWKVFLSERGSATRAHLSANEDDACVYFLKRIFQLQLQGSGLPRYAGSVGTFRLTLRRVLAIAILGEVRRPR